MGLLRANTSYHVQLQPPGVDAAGQEYAEVSVFVEKGSVLDETDPIVAASVPGSLSNIEAQATMQVSAHGPALRAPVIRQTN